MSLSRPLIGEGGPGPGDHLEQLGYEILPGAHGQLEMDVGEHSGVDACIESIGEDAGDPGPDRVSAETANDP